MAAAAPMTMSPAPAGCHEAPHPSDGHRWLAIAAPPAALIAPTIANAVSADGAARDVVQPFWGGGTMPIAEQATNGATASQWIRMQDHGERSRPS
jgi:hypothetical protein